MLTEAVEIISAVFGGDYVNYRGAHFSIDSAKLWDVGTPAPRVGIAVSGEQSCELAGRYADAMIAVEPDPDLGAKFDAAGGTGNPRVGQVPISWDPNRQAAIDRAHEQFRWFGGGWKVNAEIPGTAGSRPRASLFVRRTSPTRSPAAPMLTRCEGGIEVRRCRLHRYRGGPNRRRYPARLLGLGRTRAAAGIAAH
jgi:G6PDH family F420-dependent oxidoreductase